MCFTIIKYKKGMSKNGKRSRNVRKKLQDAVETAASGGKVVGLFEDGAGNINVVSNREGPWKKTAISIGVLGVDEE